jgi:hypothetical protein
MPPSRRAASILPLVLLFAACGPPPPPAVTPVGNAGPGACPAAAAVRPAEWKQVAPDDPYGYGGMTYGAPAIPHWQIPLEVEVTDWENPPPNEWFGPRTVDEVRPQVAAPLGTEAWIYTSDRAEPCRAPITGYYQGRDNLGGPDYGVLAAQAEGCAPAGELTGVSWAVIGDGDPSACRMARAEPRGSREATWGEDNTPSFGAAAAPPAPIAAAVPQKPCASPACEQLWSATTVSTPALEVSEVTMTWVKPVGDDYCRWEEESDHAFYLGPPGGPLTRASLRGPESEVWMSLSGVLYDAQGARLLLSSANGEYGVHAIDHGALGTGKIETWYVGHEEDYYGYSLWNVCGL